MAMFHGYGLFRDYYSTCDRYLFHHYLCETLWNYQILFATYPFNLKWKLRCQPKGLGKRAHGDMLCTQQSAKRFSQSATCFYAKYSYSYENWDASLCSTFMWWKKMHFYVMLNNPTWHITSRFDGISVHGFFTTKSECMATSDAWLNHYNEHISTWNAIGTWVSWKCFDTSWMFTNLLPQSWFMILRWLPPDCWEMAQTFVTHHWVHKF